MRTACLHQLLARCLAIGGRTHSLTIGPARSREGGLPGSARAPPAGAWCFDVGHRLPVRAIA
jgi:hypothetical protein